MDSKGFKTMVDDTKENDLHNKKSLKDRRAHFGATLREIREIKGLSVKDLVHLTRISPPFVHALEEGQFESLPGQVFGRGFMKNICKALEVDPLVYLEHYDECWKDEKLHPLAPKKRVLAGRFPYSGGGAYSSMAILKSLSGGKFVRWFLVPTAILGVLGVSWFQLKKLSSQAPVEESTVIAVNPVVPTTEVDPQVSHPENETADPVFQENSMDPELALAEEKAAATIPQEPAATAAPVVVNEPPLTTPAPPVAVEAQAVAEAAPQDVIPQGEGRVVFEVREAVQIKSKLDDEKNIEKVYEPGNYTLSFKKRADLYIFNTEALDLTFNNQKIKSLAAHGKERKLSFMVDKPH